MAFIWGSGRKSKNPGGAIIPYYCANEESLRNFALFENYRYAHLYGIRIAKWNCHRWFECTDCGIRLQIDSHEAFLAAKTIAETWNVLRVNNPTVPQIWEIVAKVSEHVLKDPDGAEIARSVAQELEP